MEWTVWRYQGKWTFFIRRDIIEAGLGRFCYPTESGGAVRETDTRIDVYAPSDSSKGHSHTWHNGDTNETGDHD